MKPLYALLRERCGLSIREAAAFHDVPDDTIKSWSSGRRTAPAGVLAELRELYARIEAAADSPDRTLPAGAQSAAQGLAALRSTRTATCREKKT